MLMFETVKQQSISEAVIVYALVLVVFYPCLLA